MPMHMCACASVLRGSKARATTFISSIAAQQVCQQLGAVKDDGCRKYIREWS
jgi:hypothetical protein